MAHWIVKSIQACHFSERTFEQVIYDGANSMKQSRIKWWNCWFFSTFFVMKNLKWRNYAWKSRNLSETWLEIVKKSKLTFNLFDEWQASDIYHRSIFLGFSKPNSRILWRKKINQTPHTIKIDAESKRMKSSVISKKKNNSNWFLNFAIFYFRFNKQIFIVSIVERIEWNTRCGDCLFIILFAVKWETMQYKWNWKRLKENENENEMLIKQKKQINDWNFISNLRRKCKNLRLMLYFWASDIISLSLSLVSLHLSLFLVLHRSLFTLSLNSHLWFGVEINVSWCLFFVYIYIFFVFHRFNLVRITGYRVATIVFIFSIFFLMDLNDTRFDKFLYFRCYFWVLQVAVV